MKSGPALSLSDKKRPNERPSFRRSWGCGQTGSASSFRVRWGEFRRASKRRRLLVLRRKKCAGRRVVGREPPRWVDRPRVGKKAVFHTASARRTEGCDRKARRPTLEDVASRTSRASGCGTIVGPAQYGFLHTFGDHTLRARPAHSAAPADYYCLRVCGCIYSYNESKVGITHYYTSTFCQQQTLAT